LDVHASGLAEPSDTEAGAHDSNASLAGLHDHGRIARTGRNLANDTPTIDHDQNTVRRFCAHDDG
jgi:hypothetical protein